MRFKFTYVLLLFLIQLPSVLIAQRCATRIPLEYRQKSPSSIPIFERKLSEVIHYLKSFGTPSKPDTIPVVVHIFHNGEDVGEGLNISDEQIYSQIEVLNEDFNRRNPDSVNTRKMFRSDADRLNLYFSLAKQTPNGLLTNGIVRKVGGKSAYSSQDSRVIANESYWPPEDYLNIWIIDIKDNTYGWGTFPDLVDMGSGVRIGDIGTVDADGIFIDYQAFGSIAKYPIAQMHDKLNLGRTLTHEVGHFFGLRHVWDDQEKCTGNDYVEDTPRSSEDYDAQCPSSGLSCNSDDMFENYMYYTNDACMNMFSTGQVKRMKGVLEISPRRASLLLSKGDELPLVAVHDLAILNIKNLGKIICESDVTPVITVINLGNVDIPSFTVVYHLDGDTNHINILDTLKYGEQLDIPLTSFDLKDGEYDFELELINLVEGDYPTNNYVQYNFTVDREYDFIPLIEDFENDSDWLVINDDNNVTWKLTNVRGIYSEKSMFVNSYNYEDKSAQDWLVSPILDFSSVSEASVRFNTSYAINDDFTDNLVIRASDNCGASFNYYLDAFNSNSLTNNKATSEWIPEGYRDWESHTTDLSRLAGKKQVRIAFILENGFGNNLYLDNIEFYQINSERIIPVGEGGIIVHPNPTKDRKFNISINTNNRQDLDISIYDSSGRIISYHEYLNVLNQTYAYDIINENPGMYYIRVTGEFFNTVKKLVLVK